MSNKNYNKMYNKPEEGKTNEIETIDDKPTTLSENKSTNVPESEDDQTNPENKTTDIPEFKVNVDPIFGEVFNCSKLNIRNTPNIDSEILVVVNKGTKVEINEELSTEDFYSVTAYCPDDITVIGYAMKDFILIK